MDSSTPTRSPMSTVTHQQANRSSPSRPPPPAKDINIMSSPLKIGESKIPFPISKLPRPHPSPIKPPALSDLTEENLLDIEPSAAAAVGSPTKAAPHPGPSLATKAFKPTSRPPPPTTVAIPSTSTLNLRKRKEPDHGGPSTTLAKRTVSAAGPSKSSSSSTTVRPTTSGGSRSVSASAASTSRAALSRPVTASSKAAPTSTMMTSRSRLAASTSSAAAAATAGGASRTRPPGSSLMAGRPIAGGTTRTTRSTLGSSTSSAALGRSLGPGSGGSGGGGGSRIGSGMASAAAVQSQGGRVTEVEKAISSLTAMMQLEQERRMAIEQGQQAMQQQLATSQNEEREARRNLSSAGEEIATLKAKHRDEVDELERQVKKREREGRELEAELGDVRADLDLTRAEVRELKLVINTQSTSQLVMVAENDALKASNAQLKREIEGNLEEIAQMKEEVSRANEHVAEVEEELRTAETIRRKLHNQIQELKGNIRVFARVRPALAHEQDTPDGVAQMDFGPPPRPGEDTQQQLVLYRSRDSALGNKEKESIPFAFDKVFQPTAGQQEVFEEISMLTQSVLDGYNVCIFAYGQTGSGKSWTMEGGKAPDSQGMIPRAMDMVFREASYLKERGWEYTMGGQYVEIYNEQINDLFGDGTIDGTKHEIKHEGSRTRVTGIEDKIMNSSQQVADLLVKAGRRRAVAATLMNERSSRSHSVFSLRVTGRNDLTGEACEGILNLVDLAGSERLDRSGTADDKDRRKEAININKSLSCLQNVIQKLAEKASDGKVHVNYRDSQLTYLLQNSLSGQSKTLMFCNISPMAGHINETLNSLRFATKVNGTTIGTARKQTR